MDPQAETQQDSYKNICSHFIQAHTNPLDCRVGQTGQLLAMVGGMQQVRFPNQLCSRDSEHILGDTRMDPEFP